MSNNATMKDGYRKVSTHFKLHEFTRSQVASRNGFDNSLPESLWPNILSLANELETVRRFVGHPMLITSGYRCPPLNKHLGGSGTSAHMKGLAADFEIPGVSNLEVYERIKAIVKNNDNSFRYDQLIGEYLSQDDPSAGWIHLSVPPSDQAVPSFKSWIIPA